MEPYPEPEQDLNTLIVRKGTRKTPGALFAYKSNPYQCME